MSKLRDAIEKRKKERAEQLKIEESTAQMAPDEMADSDEVSVLFPTWDPEENHELTHIATQIERMGFELRIINEENGYHVWVAGPWKLFMHPDELVVKLEKLLPSGTMFAQLTDSIEETDMKHIVEHIAEAFFCSGDEEVDRMITKDRFAWNMCYAKKFGKWQGGPRDLWEI